jgi:hypothetical protein
VSGRKVIGARNGPDKTVSHVLIEGNRNFTPIAKAIGMAERGDLSNVHAVHRVGAKAHLRTNPDGQERNNLDRMAKD